MSYVCMDKFRLGKGAGSQNQEKKIRPHKCTCPIDINAGGSIMHCNKGKYSIAD